MLKLSRCCATISGGRQNPPAGVCHQNLIQRFFYLREGTPHRRNSRSSVMRTLSLIAPRSRNDVPGINDVIGRFNRDTKRLATLVLGVVVSAAFILAALVQDRHPKAVGATEDVVPAGEDRSLNLNSATLYQSVNSQGKKSDGEVTTGQVRSVDHSFTEGSSKGNPSSQGQAAASTPIPLPAFTPETIKINADTSSWWPAHWQGSARLIRPKIRNVRYRSSAMLRSVDVKVRLVALWHRSLARSERSHSGFLWSKLHVLGLRGMALR